jgi:hypothetical protein
MHENLDKKPGRPSKSEKLRAVHTLALRRFAAIESATRDDREMSRNDRRFATVPGAQWEGPLQQQFAKKPRFELNRVQGAKIRLEGEHRLNRSTVDFMPRDGSTDELSDVCDGLFRADWQDSHGDGAADNAFSEAIMGGVGAIRIRCVMVDEDGDCDEQRIKFEPIVDADCSVYWDLNSKDQQKRDAMHVFVVVPITRETYEEDFPQDDPASWPVMTDSTTAYDWYTPDVVKVAEYYVVERREVTTWEVEPLIGESYNMTADDLDEAPEVDDDDDEPGMTERERLTAEGCKITKNATKKRVREVHKYLLSGSCVLEDCGIINGTMIPVIPCYGIRDFVDNKERWSGLVRVTKDAQRVVNMGFSRLAEISAYSPVSVPIFHPEQVVGHQQDWRDANIDPKAFLQLNMMTDPDGRPIPMPLQMTQPPQIPPATVGVLSLAQGELKDLLPHAGQDRERIVPNTSGKAVELIQQAQDIGSVIYLDNFKLFMERVGECWLSAAPDVYVEEGRKLKTIGADMKTRASITLGEPGVDEKGQIYEGGKYDLSRAKYDVVVDVGPSTTTKRAATVTALTQMLMVLPQDDTETRKMLSSVALANMEGEGLSDLRDYYRKQLVRAGVYKPTKQEAEEMAKEQAAAAANQKPDPQAQALIAVAQKEANLAVKAQADTALSLANKSKAEAETRKVEAQTIEIVADLDVRTGGQMPPMR